MITIDGTVTEILGYPTLLLIREASRPAAKAPMNAAAAGGHAVRSTSSSLNVFATAPIPAATAARRTGLLNRETKHSTETRQKPKQNPRSQWQ